MPAPLPPASPAVGAPAPSRPHRHRHQDRPAPTALLRATAVAATVGVLAALVALGLLLRPVHTPFQDCGTQLGFVLDGRVNEFGDPNDPPRGMTADEVTAANQHPCRDRVARKAKPAGVLLLLGMGTAVGATGVELVVRTLGWRSRRRAGGTQSGYEGAGST